jgi:hypothetical protein
MAALILFVLGGALFLAREISRRADRLEQEVFRGAGLVDGGRAPRTPDLAHRRLQAIELRRRRRTVAAHHRRPLLARHRARAAVGQGS